MAAHASRSPSPGSLLPGQARLASWVRPATALVPISCLCGASAAAGEETHSQAYYIIKAAQERQELTEQVTGPCQKPAVHAMALPVGSLVAKTRSALAVCKQRGMLFSLHPCDLPARML